jgi:hypothetical protein
MENLNGQTNLNNQLKSQYANLLKVQKFSFFIQKMLNYELF